jgi:phosphate transport system ATP-binding protein
VALWDEVKDKLKKILSGGQQQVMYCPCSAIKPSILLMDEPTLQIQFTSKLKNIYELKNKYTIVIVTHIMHQASDTTAFFLYG